MGTNLQRACGQLGAAVRYGWTDEELGELRQQLVAVQLEEAIAAALSAEPALGMVHRRRLAALILPDGVDDGGPDEESYRHAGADLDR